MDRIRFDRNSLIFSRAGELLRVTSPAPNALRVEAFPDCREFTEDFTLLPTVNPVAVEEGEIVLTVKPMGTVISVR